MMIHYSIALFGSTSKLLSFGKKGTLGRIPFLPNNRLCSAIERGECAWSRDGPQAQNPGLDQLEAVSGSVSSPQSMLRRSSAPTASMGCLASWARFALRKVRPVWFSAIHLPAKTPSWMSLRTAFMFFLVSS